MKKLINDELYLVTNFVNELKSLEWRDLCHVSVCALKRLLPIWEREVRFKYFTYADHVCGMRHKIPTKIIIDYVIFLENNPQSWGTQNAFNHDILELWVALTDNDFSISRDASIILLATYDLMITVCDTTTTCFFIEFFAYLSNIFEDWDSYMSFWALVKNDKINPNPQLTGNPSRASEISTHREEDYIYRTIKLILVCILIVLMVFILSLVIYLFYIVIRDLIYLIFF
ncbi:MAG: hypothetical protein LBP59_18860 [Planctomycetaceae bacterium]|jgi:hypothetical protein|nr:hypothetical protein [Planctomycetaceae bacterium]